MRVFIFIPIFCIGFFGSGQKWVTVKGSKTEIRTAENVSQPAAQQHFIYRQSSANSLLSAGENINSSRELLSSRTRDSKTFINHDGSFSTQLFSGNIHYSRNGELLDIQTDIKAVSDSHWPFANLDNLFQTHFGGTAAKGIKTQTEEESLYEFLNTRMYWETANGIYGVRTASDVSLEVNGNTAYYPGIFGDISARFGILNGQRSLDYIIPSREALGEIPESAEYLVFSEDILLPPGWTYETTDKGIYIKNNTAQPLFLFPTPFSTDSSNDIRPSKNTHYETQLNGQTLTVLTKVKTEWLLAENRVFPIEIDPTVKWVPQNGSHTGYALENGTQFSDPDMFLGFYPPHNPTQRVRPFIRFQTDGIPQNANITAATGYVTAIGFMNYPGDEARFQFYSSANPLSPPPGGLYQSMTLQLSQDNSGNLNGQDELKNAQFTQAGLDYIQSSLSDGFIALGILPTGPGPDWETTWQGDYVTFYGYESWMLPDPILKDFIPYLIVEYDTCAQVTAYASNDLICAGEEITLFAESTASDVNYFWYTSWNQDLQTGTLLGTGPQLTISPEESQTFVLVAEQPGCTTHTPKFLPVSVLPSLPPVEPSPPQTITCSGEFKPISVDISGLDSPHILGEDFDPLNNDWISVTENNPEAHWEIYESDGQIASPDHSDFVISGAGNCQMGTSTSLISPPLSFAGHEAPISLSFTHTLQTHMFCGAEVQLSADGGENWITLKSYDTSVGAPTAFEIESIALDEYAGEPHILIRFYNMSGDTESAYWALDDIEIQGAPLPLDITWAPYEGLYIDENGNSPYSGENTDMVYASPLNTTDYTVSAMAGNSCPAKGNVLVSRGDKDWKNTGSKDWNLAGNWSEDGVPTSESCVRIPDIPYDRRPVIDGNMGAFARNLTLEAGGKLTIKGGSSLTVTDFIISEAEEDDFLIETDANLLQINDNPTLPNSGNITAERTVTDIRNNINTGMDYIYWSSPVGGQDIYDFSPETPVEPQHWAFLTYNESDDYFDNLNYATEPEFLPGKGYAIRAQSGESFPDPHEFTYRFRGEFHNGIFTKEILKSGQGYNLLGNPYPSNMDFEAFYYLNLADPADTSSAAIFPNVWFWTNESTYQQNQQGGGYQNNGYAAYNIHTGGVPGSGYGEQPPIPTNGHIKVGQGFLIQKREAGSAQLIFNNSIRTADDDTRFYSKGSKDRFWLSLVSPSKIYNTALIGYTEGAVEAADSEFNTKLWGSSDAVYFPEGEEKYIIRGKAAPFDQRDIVTLGTEFFEDGVYVLQLAEIEGVFEQTRIYLIDKDLGITHLLSAEPYKFFTYKGEFNHRFEIRYRRAGFGTSATPNMITAATQKEDIIILSSEENIREVQLFDILGMEVYQNVKADGRELRIPASRWMNSILFARIITEDGEVTTTKVLLK